MGKGKRPARYPKGRQIVAEGARAVALEEAAPLAPSRVQHRPFAERAARPAWLVFSALLCVFYFWTATSSEKAFRPRDTSRDFYNQLTDAFLKGQTYLDAKPSPELLALPDPYDPAVNVPYRLNDASLYRGRYYLYFGAVPVVLLYVPWRAITGAALSDEVAATLFCSGGYVFWCLLLFLLLEAADVRPPLWSRACAVLALGLGQFAPIVLRHALVYDVAVSSGYCLLAGGIYFLARGMLRRGRGRWSLAAAGLALGLSVGSRPHCALAAMVLAALYAIYLVRWRGLRGRGWLNEFLPFLAPLLFVGLALGWYNFIRFGNPLEFGVHYSVGSLNLLKPMPWSLRLQQIPASLYYLLLCPPGYLGRFPFFELNGGAEPFGNPDLVPATFLQEPVGGALVLAPICIAGLMLPWFLWRRADRFAPPLRAFLTAMVTCGLLIFAALCWMPAASGRYPLDFAPPLIAAGIFLCLVLPIGRGTPAMLAIAMLWGAAVNVACSINSYKYPLERAPNTNFQTLASFFGAGPEAITKGVDSLHWEATVTFPRALPDHRETLLGSGNYEAWDVLFVQHVKGDKAMFAWVHSGISDRWGPATWIDPGKPQRLAADYSAAAKRLTVRLNGEVVLDHPATFYRTSRDRVTPGRLRVGRFGLWDFGGKIENSKLSVVAQR
ncbi:MAG: hypothetical protein ABI759_20840 [Candidatus Solibacter sp.]